MLLGELILVALQSVRANLFRSILTMLGIIIGVASVITMLAVGAGARGAVDGIQGISQLVGGKPPRGHGGGTNAPAGGATGPGGTGTGTGTGGTGGTGKGDGSLDCEGVDCGSGMHCCADCGDHQCVRDGTDCPDLFCSESTCSP